jgi:hypothetical protein
MEWEKIAEKIRDLVSDEKYNVMLKYRKER